VVKAPIERKWMILLGVLSILVLLGAYSWLSHAQHVKNPTDTTIPGWGQLWDGVVTMCSVDERSGERWLLVDAKATATRLFVGLGISVLGAVLIGVHMGALGVLDGLLVPGLSFLAKVVPTAAMAVFFVLVGTELKMFASMIVFGVLPALSLTIYLAVKQVPDELVHKAYTLGASHMEVVWVVIFPTTLPRVIDAIRLSIGPAMVYLLAAELLVSDVGFGYRIRLLSRRLDMEVVYPYLALLAFFGLFMDYSLRWAQRRLCPWFQGGEG